MSLSSTSHPLDANLVPAISSKLEFFIISSLILIMVIASSYWIAPSLLALSQDLKFITSFNSHSVRPFVVYIIITPILKTGELKLEVVKQLFAQGHKTRKWPIKEPNPEIWVFVLLISRLYYLWERFFFFEKLHRGERHSSSLRCNLVQTICASLKKWDKESISFGFLNKVFISYSRSCKNNIWTVLFTKLIHAYYSIH